MTHSGIYTIRCKSDGKFYIGSATNYKNRWALHRRQLNAGTHHCTHLQNAWNKYGEAAFTFSLVEQVQKQNLITMEQQWINKFWDDGILFNSCRVAKSRLGMKHSPETKLKIGKRSYACSSETRLKMSIQSKGEDNNFYGRRHSVEARQKMVEAARKRATKESTREKLRLLTGERNSFYAHTHSEKTKLKMSIAAKARWAKMPQCQEA